MGQAFQFYKTVISRAQALRVAELRCGSMDCHCSQPGKTFRNAPDMIKPGFTNAKYCLVAPRPAALASYEGVGFPAVLCDKAFTAERWPRPCASVLMWLPDKH